MFRSIGEVIDAELAGKTRTYNFRKTSSGNFPSGNWYDMSSFSGNPIAKYWFDAPPLVAKAVYQSSDGGIFHGANVSPSKKYLKKLYIGNAGGGTVPCNLVLLDYLLYYPTIEDSTTDPQVLDNTITLPRYETGEGVQAIIVSVASRTGGQSLQLSYTNSQGVAGRTSQLAFQNTNATNGTLLTSGVGSGGLLLSSNPYIGLQDGDTGIRSIESVSMISGTDTGLFSIILVKPIAQITIANILAPLEKDFLMHSASLPIIEDDAFLNFISTSSNSTAPQFLGDMKVIWD
jgi:hypothetical protein